MTKVLSLSILAVKWDEITGPVVISYYPELSILEDPQTVALQIYMASITVFGQHGAAKRTEFSIPLLSLGDDIRTRVGFDWWKDESVRGGQRQFFLAFIMDDKTQNTINIHLEHNLWKYLDLLKVNKDNFLCKDVYNKIIESIEEEEHQFVLDSDTLKKKYTDYSMVLRTQNDLDNYLKKWESIKDSVTADVLENLLLIANTLENIDDIRAGEAFYLTGEILYRKQDYRNSLYTYKKSADAFLRAGQIESCSIALGSAGMSAYSMNDYKHAQNLFSEAIKLITDIKQKTILYVNLALATYQLGDITSSNNYFERAILLAKEHDKQLAIRTLSIYASRLMEQANKACDDETTRHQLLLEVVNKRKEVSDIAYELKKYNESAINAILAGKVYFAMGDVKKTIELVELAAHRFYEAEDYENAAKALMEIYNKVDDWTEKINSIQKALGYLKEGIITPNRYRLIGEILYLEAKCFEEQNEWKKALQSYLVSLENMEKSNARRKTLVANCLQIANIYYKMEFYQQAANYFVKVLSFIDENKDKEQQAALRKNAMICYKQASTFYYHSGVINLENNNEAKAVEMFQQSTETLIKGLAICSDSSVIEAINESINNRIKSLERKLPFLTDYNAIHSLKKVISTLKQIKI